MTRRTLVAGGVCLLTLASLSLTPLASGAPPGTITNRVAPPSDPADLDVLYVGAHPDDEASRLSVFGEWAERYGARTGVVTVTRGEGGGNAAGPEEGPALGLIREREERAAVGGVGISDVYNLDKVDFYYSVSAPLHQDAWKAKDTLRRLVRVIRETTPDVIATMNPAPSPGNHGGHQEAALLAIEAYAAAGDPTRFPGQIKRDGLKPFSPSKLFTTAAAGSSGSTGPNCATSFTPTNRADDIYGVWSGRESREYGTSWAQVERNSQREYISQGWGGFPDVSASPADLSCDFFSQIDSRVPFTRGNLTANAAASSTMLEGALLESFDGLPLGTGLDISTRDFDVVPAGTSTVDFTLTAPARKRLPRATALVDLPTGWSTPTPKIELGTLRPGKSVTTSVTVTAPRDAVTGERALVGLTIRSGGGSGYNNQQLSVVPKVSGVQQPLPQVDVYEAWARRNGVDQLTGTVKRVLTLPSGGSRTVGVDVTNNGTQQESGNVTLDLPTGFSAVPSNQAFDNLAAGETVRVDFEVTNSDASLPTSNAGGTAGDYDYTVTTSTNSGASGSSLTSTSAPALELVPTAAIEESPAPELDGVIDEGEYSAQIDLSRLWEGSACSSASDCSGTGYVTLSGDVLYVAADVTDDVIGTPLDPATDCKRHWRTDSLEIAIDPSGDSENTSTTFKAAVLPNTSTGGACAERDADNSQGPIGQFPQIGGNERTSLSDDNVAPGFEAVSKLTEPYTGYVVETKIPLEDLPSTIDPERMGFNMFIYDSDTQDKTGQTRLGWSTFRGVQGDPYRWGQVTVDGDLPQVETKAPNLTFPGLNSLDSPQSITQAVRTGVPLSGLPGAVPARSAKLMSATQVGRFIQAKIKVRGAGTAHLFAVSGGGTVRGKVVRRLQPGTRTVRIPVSGGSARVVLGYDAARGTTSSAKVVRN